MGRNKGSKTGVVVTQPVVCQVCEATFHVTGKRRPDGPRPAKFCSEACYHASRTGIRNPNFRGGAPKGRIPWNKGKSCPQLAGERNGMFGRTHTPETRMMLSRLSSLQLGELTRRVAGARVPLPRSGPEYNRLFQPGWAAIRKAALERDSRTCAICGASGGRLNVHHIEPFGLVLKHEIDNLITLCTSCHHQVHRGALAMEGRS
jgi:hypothetical protein